ncbi:MAG TPA: hypothetical protein PKY82_32925 [Pyrinomonadaceae bacterium]|nr:hypothetical protein [Pyrinomonadaceae bacterium]
MSKYRSNYKRGELVRVDGFTSFLGVIVKVTGNFEYQIKDIETGLTDKNFDYAESTLQEPTISEKLHYQLK